MLKIAITDLRTVPVLVGTAGNGRSMRCGGVTALT